MKIAEFVQKLEGEPIIPELLQGEKNARRRPKNAPFFNTYYSYRTHSLLIVTQFTLDRLRCDKPWASIGHTVAEQKLRFKLRGKAICCLMNAQNVLKFAA